MCRVHRALRPSRRPVCLVTDRTAASPVRGPYLAVTATLVALVTIIAFEAMSISTVMPTVGRDLDVGSAYGLAFSTMFTAQLLGIVLAPAFVDRYGPLPPVRAGQVLFAAGSAAAGLAPTYDVLLAGRVIAGLGAGLALVAIYVIIGAAYPGRLRPQVMAWISAAWVLPSVVGPLLAATITARSSWRIVFLVVVPLIAVTLVAIGRAGRLTTLGTDHPDTDRTPSDATHTNRSHTDRASPLPTGSLPRTRARARPRLQARARTSWLGLTVAGGAAAYQWASTQLVPVRPVILAVAAAGAVVLVLGTRALLPPGALRLARGLPALMASKFLLTAGMNGAISFVPLMLVQQRGYSLEQAGMLLTLVSIGWATGSWIQGREGYLGRAGDLVTVGGACVAAGLAGLWLVTATGWWAWSYLPVVILIGVGMGLAMSSMAVLTLELAPPSEHASASSSLQLADVLGSVVGIATCGALYAILGDEAPQGDATAYLTMWALTVAWAALSSYAGHRTRPA